jgi:hypothetical protein
VKVGPLNSIFATKVHQQRLPLRPRRQIATQGHSEDMPRRSGRLSLPGAAARSKNPTVAPHTLRVRYLSEDSIISELASEMASWQPLLVALKRACQMILVNKFAQEFGVWGGSLGTVSDDSVIIYLTLGEMTQDPRSQCVLLSLRCSCPSVLVCK